jgi:pyoverdine/dityrosine biosynthesis protein Dit1
MKQLVQNEINGTEVADKVLSIFENFRMAPTPLDEYNIKGKAILKDKVDIWVKSNQPINFAMLGYPMKSTNIRDKVIGVLPDRAEEESIKNFGNFAKQIQQVYQPGINVNIVNDGLVFSDVLGVNDNIVEAYKEITIDMAKGVPMTFYDLRDFYSKKRSMIDVRDTLMRQFGITGEELERRILMDADVNFLYRGMMKFMEEEFKPWTFPSNSQLHKHAKKVAKEMMFRNEAYSNLVKTEFSDSIRLSMHPSVNNGAKYSFQLIPSPKAWSSPWHAALLIDEEGDMATIHRKDAEERKYELIYNNGRPWYYQAPLTTNLM